MPIALLVLVLALQAKPSVPQAERPSENYKATSANGESAAQKQQDSSKDTGSSPNPDNVAKGDEQQANAEKMEERRDRKTELRLNRIYVYATVFGVVGGWVVLGVLIYQTILTRRSIVSTFRPKLVVRGVTLRVPWQIRFVLVNQGGTRAHMMISNVTLTDIEGKFPAVPPYTGEHSSLGKHVIGPGNFIEKVITLEPGHIQQINADYTRKKGGSADSGSFHILGYVKYRDDNGVIRYMAFCRLFNVQTDRFETVNDSDYEYAD